MSSGVLEIFSIGLGPSSSHTVGPMRAGAMFAQELIDKNLLSIVDHITVDTFGSLASTGKGHGTFDAILLGLEGNNVEDIEPDYAIKRTAEIETHKKINLAGQKELIFHSDLIKKYPYTIKKRHPNALTISAYADNNNTLYTQEYYSIGGGFIETEDKKPDNNLNELPYPFSSSAQLLELTAQHNCAISEIVWTNEISQKSEKIIREGILLRWSVMSGCLERGLRNQGTLPGDLNIKRRAPKVYKELTSRVRNGDFPDAMDWLNVAALAVNEENASGGRVVTAPTNGAAGIFPAVLYYALRSQNYASSKERENAIIRFFLTATAFVQIIKKNASISGAEIGCQGEIGSACAIAAAAYADMCGAIPQQVENAAEIAIEHHLGLTCDPIGGLVQIPCIERNAVGAIEAINAARLASYGDGTHYVSLDNAIETMRQTGLDMLSKYKETSLGGLAITVVPVNIVEC